MRRADNEHFARDALRGPSLRGPKTEAHKMRQEACVRSIMLVDDELVVRRTFSEILESYGYSVRTASSPEEAVKLLDEEDCDLVFVDQSLGPYSGLDLVKLLRGRDPSLSFVMITGHGTTELAVRSFHEGVSDFINKPFFTVDLLNSIKRVELEREMKLEKKKFVADLEQRVKKQTDELKAVYFSVLSSLAQAMEKKDIGTYGHCRRVSYCARLIAAALDLDEEERGDLKAAAMLHDIGKIGISDFILGKSGPLDEDETGVIKSHPEKGVDILKPLKQFQPILPAILHHHESYDGTGYPHGLSGADIPLHARIIAIGDTYDAIVSARPYRSPAGHERAIEELVREAGRQFDPEIVRLFVEYDRRYRVMTSTSQVPLGQ